MEQPRPGSRLYVVTPRVDDAAAMASALGAMLGAADVAAVLLRLAEGDERTLINRIKTIAPVVQGKQVALLLDGRAELVARAGADGAHLSGIDALKDALPALKPDRIAGVGGLASRDDAMIAGESGADYVMFGEPEADGRRPGFSAIADRVQWWSEIFQVPCIGYATSLDEVGALVAAGAEFVAVGDLVFDDPRGAATAIANVTRRLGAPEQVP